MKLHQHGDQFALITFDNAEQSILVSKDQLESFYHDAGAILQEMDGARLQEERDLLRADSDEPEFMRSA